VTPIVGPTHPSSSVRSSISIRVPPADAELISKDPPPALTIQLTYQRPSPLACSSGVSSPVSTDRSVGGIPGPSSATTSEVHDSLGSSAAVISTRERSVSLWRIAF